jgi:hypothetical protein
VVTDAMLSQVIEAWRINHPVPDGCVSLVDQLASLLKTMVRDLYDPYRAALPTGRIMRPVKSGATVTLETAAAVQGQLAVFLIEEYQLTSFLGKDGVGRTLTTLSLLPGEETTIRFKTWRNTSTTRTDTASVVDSEEQEVSEEFATKLEHESSETTTRAEASSWSASASAKAEWWGVASVEASAETSGDIQTGRENFARTAAEEVAKNARVARSNRKTELATSTTTTTVTGAEDSVDRIVKNVNLRRTLNFLFRELNQEYVTRLHLTGIKFAHCTPGKDGTWTEYALADLPELLHRLIVESQRPKVAAMALSPTVTVYDQDMRPVHPLQLLTVDGDGSPTVTELKPAGGMLNLNDMPVKGSGRFVRWKPGPLAPAGAEPPDSDHAVDGVLLSEQSIVMPTGTIVVDAALGAYDALDEYAMRAQEAQLVASEVANQREALLNEALGKLDPEQRVQAYAQATFGPANPDNAELVTPE